MKKKVRKLILSRETLYSLEDLRSAFGGGTLSTACTIGRKCSVTCAGGCDGGTTDPTLLATCGVCSGDCA